MNRNMRFFGIFCCLALLLSGVVLWWSEREEERVFDAATSSLFAGDPDAAQKTLFAHRESIISSSREMLRLGAPALPFLLGQSLFQKGETTSQQAWAESMHLCEERPPYVFPECGSLAGEAYAYLGDRVILQDTDKEGWGNVAIAFYTRAIDQNPNDVEAKKALEFLLVMKQGKQGDESENDQAGKAAKQFKRRLGGSPFGEKAQGTVGSGGEAEGW